MDNPTPSSPSRGRRPAFTLEKAREVIEARLFGFQDSPTTEAFIQSLVAEGVLPHPIHPRTMGRLLRGEMFPHLTDENGRPIDYSKVPAFRRGHPREYPEDLNYETGEPQRLPRLRRILMQKVLEESHKRIAIEFSVAMRQLREVHSAQLAAAERKLVELENRLAVLEAAKA